MNFAQIKLAGLLAGISALCAISALIFVRHTDSALENGNLYIAEEVFTDIAEIQISTPSGQVTLLPEGHLWQVKKADYYYADFNLMHNLLTSLKTARIANKQNTTPDLITELNLQTSGDQKTLASSLSIKDAQGRVVEHILLGASTPDKEGTFAMRPTDTSIYTLNQYINFPKQLFSWVQQPITSIEENNIQQLKLNNKQYRRKDKGYPFQTQQGKDLAPSDFAQILQIFQYLPFEKVISAQNFDDTLYPNRAYISLTEFDGLVRNIEILTDNNVYWLKQTFSTTPLPTRQTNDYIKNNSFLYDGWYFQISPIEGKRLFTYANG